MVTAKKNTTKFKAATNKPPVQKATLKKTAAANPTAKSVSINKNISKNSAVKTVTKNAVVSGKKGKSEQSSTGTEVAVVQKLKLKNSNYQEMYEEWEVVERDKEAVITQIVTSR